MSRFNNGVIYTTDNCIDCNKCISQCAILGANVSVVKEGVSKIQVDSKKCNHCGKCISLCIHGARDYLDDSEKFFEDLKNGEKISVIVAPSFYITYPDSSKNILGYLKSIGVEKIYDVAFGAEICTWGHVKYLKDHEKDSVQTRAYISNTCPAFVNVVEQYHPELHKKIIPIHSPMMCTAIYVHKYLGDKNKIAFLGPCISKKDEIETKNTYNNVNYNVTYKRLMSHIGFEDISRLHAESDLSTKDFGVLFPQTGLFSDKVKYYFPSTVNIQSLSTLSKETFNMLSVFNGNKFPDAKPLFVDVMACKQGCFQGPGIEKEKFDMERVCSTISKIKNSVYENSILDLNYEERWNKLNEKFADLKFEDFIREYEDRYRQPYHIPDIAFDEIFTEMLKNTEEKRHINCGSCGYQSCHEMAKAIAFGYNQKENCIHYMHDEMTERFYTDKETGLPNRLSFLNYTQKVVYENPDKKYAIFSGDVNRFKVINDLYTFNTGNEVLRRIANDLSATCGQYGYVARLGGGNFSIFMEYTPDNMQRVYAKKHFDCNDLGVTFPVTMRFGIAITQDDDDITSLINCATICMDKQLSMVQNTYTFFTSDFRDRMMLEADITSKMQDALNNNEFVLWFQPQYEVGTKKIVGAETLCRWIQPDNKIVSPALFIPISEKNGFIRVLDKFIWRMAFVTLREWIDEGIKTVPISINISRVSLETDALIYVIKRLGDEFNIPRDLIHFEITESSYMADNEQMIYRINEIRNLGYLIAMDDFGSGYSSLNSLKDLPIDILKLDMGFIQGETNIDKGMTIISSVVKMAESLKLKTVAEGVETKKQAEFFESVGCDMIQGFLYAKPMPKEDFVKLINK